VAMVIDGGNVEQRPGMVRRRCIGLMLGLRLMLMFVVVDGLRSGSF